MIWWSPKRDKSDDEQLAEATAKLTEVDNHLTQATADLAKRVIQIEFALRPAEKKIQMGFDFGQKS